MLKLWGVVKRTRVKSGDPTAMPHSSDMATIWETESSPAAPGRMGDYSLLGVQYAEIDGEISRLDEELQRLLWQRYVVGWEDIPMMETKDVGGQVIELPVTNASGDQMYRREEYFRYDDFEPLPENTDWMTRTAAFMGCGVAEVARIATERFKRKLARKKKWELE
jgi:hypothetical protein